MESCRKNGDFLLTSNNTKTQSDNKALSIKRRGKRKLIKNQLIFVLLMETACLICQISVLCFKYWYKYRRINDQTEVWINMIFIDDYQSYKDYCLLNECEILLQDNLKSVGLLCFIIFVIGLFFMLIEIIRLAAYQTDHLYAINKTLKGKWLHPLILFLFCSCYGGYFAVVLVLLTKDQKVSNFGFAFWMGIGNIGIFFILILYYRKVKGTIFRNRQISVLLQADIILNQESYLS